MDIRYLYIVFSFLLSMICGLDSPGNPVQYMVDKMTLYAW